jgi:2-polyprenyl-3-methyl-5-hydroxy-6-metoxy-1,4-benzoquinol methylase
MEVKDCMSKILATHNYEAKRYTFIGNFFKDIKGKFLDIGCCRGGLRKYLHGDLEYYGVDVLSNNFENFVCIDLNSATLPFPNKQFDAITCTDVLEHLFYPFKMLQEIKRVLKDDGVVLLSLPNDKGLNQIFRDLFCEIRSYDDSVYDHHWRFSIKTAREFVEKEFQIIKESPEFGPIFRRYLFFLKFKKFSSAWFMLAIKK